MDFFVAIPDRGKLPVMATRRLLVMNTYLSRRVCKPQEDSAKGCGKKYGVGVEVEENCCRLWSFILLQMSVS